MPRSDRYLPMEQKELERIVIFFLKDAADRLRSLAQEMQSQTAQGRLRWLARQIDEQARLLGDDRS